VLLLAHRGASADAPENTLPAFLAAAEQGADGVELDARVCGSGEVVVCHDQRLDRLAGVPLAVAEAPWWKLRRLDVGGHLGFGPAGIPLLAEVLDAVPARFVVNVELKCDRADDRGLSEGVSALVRERRMADRVVVSSFNPLALLRMAAVDPTLRRGCLIAPDRSFLRQSWVHLPLTASYSVHPHFSQCSEANVARWRERGLAIAAWTVDDGAEARRLRALGVEYCISNRPRALRAELDRQ